FFEAVVQDRVERAARAVPWVSGELFALMNERGLGIEEVPVHPEHISRLVDLIEAGTITNRSAKEVLLAIADEGKGPDQIIEERQLAQVSDEGRLAVVVAQVIDENPAAVADYLGGKKQAIGALLGQVMRQLRGTANPAVARKLLQEELDRRGGE
ncbi:MAG TPA: Asp-tRNA(Asn)/Glu-tRNA(Gln) amidotransferase GatCAB subunit B, partial [Thermomicrobiaceae bacterium]|nr:Asp-tRNA(Asn)/Glu-tRNA(Gln) amidotransferase GatCAB subunit B [Thermomicrobiaceae bacterium]